MTCACTDTSSADTGSSQTMNAGSTESARAMPIALSLSAGELVRIARRVIGTQSDFLEQRLHAVVRGASFGELVDRQPFVHGCADGHARVERRERILEDDLHLPSHAAQRCTAQRRNVDPVEDAQSRTSAR